MHWVSQWVAIPIACELIYPSAGHWNSPLSSQRMERGKKLMRFEMLDFIRCLHLCKIIKAKSILWNQSPFHMKVYNDLFSWCRLSSHTHPSARRWNSPLDYQRMEWEKIPMRCEMPDFIRRLHFCNIIKAKYILTNQSPFHMKVHNDLFIRYIYFGLCLDLVSAHLCKSNYEWSELDPLKWRENHQLT